VAKGKPETIEEIESKRAAAKAEIEAKCAAAQVVAQEEELRLRLHAEKYKKIFEAENAKRKLIELKQLEEYVYRNSRESGNWSAKFQLRKPATETATETERTTFQHIPKNVNARAVKHVKEWLANFPEVHYDETLGELRQAFMTAFMPYLLRDFPYLKDTLNYYAERVFNMPNTTPEEQYCVLQKWVVAEEANYRKANFECRIGRDWTAAKNITFENCLWAMCDKSNTFEMDTINDATGLPYIGFIKIHGNVKDDKSRIVWQTNLNTYTDIPHLEKAPSKQKMAKEERLRLERDLDELF